jgi:hypothetical protein
LNLFCKRIALICIQNLPNEQVVAQPIVKLIAVLDAQLVEVLILLLMDKFNDVVEDSVVSAIQKFIFGVGVTFIKENEHLEG